MQISDKVGQYGRNLTNGTDELNGAQGVRKLASSLDELEAGRIFEGTVNSLKGGRAVLALGNGQVITARMDGRVNLQVGSSMFFQVKSNDGTTIAIRPYTGGTGSGYANPILLNALTSAGIPVTERSIDMVDAMMREQMSIGKESLLAMTKAMGDNPSVSVQTVVQMTKMGLPVTGEMAAQFENYSVDRNELLDEVDVALGRLGAALGDESLSAAEARDLYDSVLSILKGEGTDMGDALAGTARGAAGAPSQALAAVVQDALENGQTAENVGVMPRGTSEATAWTPLAFAEAGNVGQGGTAADGAASSQPSAQAAAQGGNAAQNAAMELAVSDGRTIGEILTDDQLGSLLRQMQGIPALWQDSVLSGEAGGDVFINTMDGGTAAEQLIMAEGQVLEGGASAADGGTGFGTVSIDASMTAGQFLDALSQALSQGGDLSGLSQLFASAEFQGILKEMAHAQWTLAPQDLREGGRIGALYERVEQQMTQLDHALQAAGLRDDSFSQAASDVRSNLDFMAQVNQMYTYIQIPLKLSGQDANGQLYVYTNKSRQREPGEELSAFLHLDLENLGATDVSIRLKDRKVNTRFYVEDDAAFHLIEKHLPVLERRLNKKGYTCALTISNEEKNVNLVEDFLKKDLPPAGKLHRYSFDVRA